jgi:hypothetical protein
MEQLLAHLAGDYVLQSDWMATRKRKSWVAAVVHAMFYGLPFLLLTQSHVALAVIVGTHAVIDRLALARYVVFAKNYIAPRSAWPVWEKTNNTGYDAGVPIWMSTWLFIIADNLMHLTINYLALGWL